MYHVKYNKQLHILEGKIKSSELREIMHESKSIDEFLGTLGDSFGEIEDVLNNETELNYVLILYGKGQFGQDIHIQTRTDKFLINTEDLIFNSSNATGLNFTVDLINNLDSYDLIIEFI